MATPMVQGSAGPVFAKLAIVDPSRTVRMRIGYVGQSGAKYQTEAILSILSAPRASASAP